MALPNITVEVKFDDTNWTDISAYVRSGSITRGTSRFDGIVIQYETGTASVVLDNRDARFDPTNASSPYVGTSNADGSHPSTGTQIVPMKQWRIRTTTDGGHTLWTGFADGWQLDYPNNGKDATCTLTGSDVQKLFKLLTITLAEPATELSSVFMSSAIAGRNAQALDTGNFTLQAGTVTAAVTWDLMQLIADSEGGELYVRGDGTIVFRRRRAIAEDTRSNTPQATFGDSGADLRYQSFSLTSDDVQMKNTIELTRVGGTEQDAIDQTAAAQFRVRTLVRNDLLLTVDSDAFDYAYWVKSILSGMQTGTGGTVTITGDIRIGSISVDPRYDPTNLNPQVLGRELGDRITVKAHPVGRAATPIVRDGIIRGINHDFTPSSWLTTWQLQDAAYFNFLVFDHTVLGTFDSNKFGS